MGIAVPASPAACLTGIAVPASPAACLMGPMPIRRA
jgi:hypothetical protein